MMELLDVKCIKKWVELIRLFPDEGTNAEGGIGAERRI